MFVKVDSRIAKIFCCSDDGPIDAHLQAALIQADAVATVALPLILPAPLPRASLRFVPLPAAVVIFIVTLSSLLSSSSTEMVYPPRRVGLILSRGRDDEPTSQRATRGERRINSVNREEGG